MKKILLLTFMIAGALVAWGQQHSVTGKVTAQEDGSALPGVSVLIKGTTSGTITDANGIFSLQASNTDILSFTYVGYLEEEVNVGDQSVIDIILTPDIKRLSEIVVIGYGTQEKKDVTGAIASVSGEDLNAIPVPSFEQALAGRAAGVQVTTSSGNPGAGASIRIRGIGTVNNAEPLYVIDGVIIGNVETDYAQVSPLVMLNPADIESIDILKDASATAIYGARAGNGVVIITTKRGRSDKMQVTFNASNAVNVVDESKWDRLSGPEWAAYYHQMKLDTNDPAYAGRPFVEGIVNGSINPPEYSWIDEAMRNGSIQNYGVSLNGGNDASQYYASLNYMDQEGIMINSDLKRYSLRFNSDHKFGKLKFGNSFFVSRTEANVMGNADATNNSTNYMSRLLYVNPYMPFMDDSLNWAGAEDFLALYPGSEGALDHQTLHSLWKLNTWKNLQDRTRIIGSFYGDWNIIEGLTFHTQFSADLHYERFEQNNPANSIQGRMEVLPSLTHLEMANNENLTWFIENTLQYTKSFGDHGLTVLAGYQAQNSHFRQFKASDGNYIDAAPDIWHFEVNEKTVNDDGTVTDPRVQSDEYSIAWVSMFGRLIYDFQDKYLLTATVRRDGSSKFGANERYGIFPAVSAGWRISEESFMQGVLPVSDLKLRIGYGISGSDNTGSGRNGLYQYSQEIGAGGEFNGTIDETIAFGQSLRRPANQNIRWEQVKMFNIGVDAGFFEDRLEMSLNYFDKTTEDMFFTITAPFEGGYEAQVTVNTGNISNKGFELDLRSTNMVAPFTWTTDFNIAFIKNRVNEIAGQERIGGISGVVNQVTPGGEVGEFYGYNAIGIFQSWDEVYGHAFQNQATLGVDSDGDGINDYDTDARDNTTALSNTAPGDVIFQDTNGDGRVNADDWVVIGSPIPDFTWGMTNTFSYRGLSLSIFLQGVHGNEIYNGLELGRKFTSPSFFNVSASGTEDRWSESNSGAANPRITQGVGPNDNLRNNNSLAIEDGSFVRIKNIRLAYNLPPKVLNFLGSSNAQIYITGTNIATFTKFTGYDPEIGLARTERAWEFGVNPGTVPLTRQFTVGASITF